MSECERVSDCVCIRYVCISIALFSVSLFLSQGVENFYTYVTKVQILTWY